jgi:cyanate permease
MSDPVRVRRARVARFVAATKGHGYALLLAAIGAFVIGAISDFPSWTVAMAVVGLIGSCVVLPIPIVLGYGIRKAEREDPAPPGS